ncbi:MAG TPA: hypothetical protein DIT07_11790 [Sphingobacteriaceae bacterium]|nr:hypothetical protein [Sphingobacteriaceae bacterium]
MGLFNNLFKGKNQIDEQLERINILRVTMRQNEALNQTRSLINELMGKPSLINGMNNTGDLGNFLTHQLNNFQRTDELQFITELAFFMITKALNKQIHPSNLYDRLIIMYNSEDFLADTIIEANNLQYNPLSLMGSRHNIKYMAEDMLLKMRFHDLFHENKFYRNSSNDDSFNGQQFIEISKMINNGQFGSVNNDDISKEGGELIKKCFVFITKKYSLEI